MIATVNAAEIQCSQTSGTCDKRSLKSPRRKRSVLTAQLLTVSKTQYSIGSWTDREIVAINRAPVANISIRIDVPQQKVSRHHQETKERGNLTADPRVSYAWNLE